MKIGMVLAAFVTGIFISTFSASEVYAAKKKSKTTVHQLDHLSQRTSAAGLRTLKRAVWRVPGVKSAKVDLGNGRLYLIHAAWMSKRKLERAISRAGFPILDERSDNRPTLLAKR